METTEKKQVAMTGFAPGAYLYPGGKETGSYRQESPAGTYGLAAGVQGGEGSTGYHEGKELLAEGTQGKVQRGMAGTAKGKDTRASSCRVAHGVQRAAVQVNGLR